MYRLTKAQREALKPLKCKALENARLIERLQNQNRLIDIEINHIVNTKPIKQDNITPIASLLSVFFKPGKTNVDSFLTAKEIHQYLRVALPKDAERLTTRQIGQGLTRLTKASSTVAKGTFGIKRGYWLRKVKR